MSNSSSNHQVSPPRAISSILNTRLPLHTGLWRISFFEGLVSGVDPMDIVDITSGRLDELDAAGGLLIPSMCHAHVHLDKCFILDKGGELVNGDFSEAMTKTATAKAAFVDNVQDLYDRGDRLIRESIQAGVTAMRAHVEVDVIVGSVCLDVAKRLKTRWAGIFLVQIAVFAQEALFTSESDISGQNYKVLQSVLGDPDVEVVGSAPYVEPDSVKAKQNIQLILELAMTHNIHCDFHLDYNFEISTHPLIYDLLSELQLLIDSGKYQWTKHLTIGHVTRLQLLDAPEWRALSAAFALLEQKHKIPVTLVSLPQSDMYMLKPPQNDSATVLRTTLHVPRLVRDYGVRVAMSVNNVENAFTPQGSLDPLASLCTFGVAIFQTAKEKDVETLVRAVTQSAKTAIGWDASPDLFPVVGDPADFVLLHQNMSLRMTVLNPSYDRSTIVGGRLVAQRRSMGEVWLV